ncbi:MAG: hypothetical protein IKK41_00170 [Oscillospiraceae bacterium]|nr:hypothetical protein [Oscillospiraceae bacterium]
MIGVLDYSLCDQTVTVYRKQGDQILRQVADGCYYTWQEKQEGDERGTRRETVCQLILPGDGVQIHIGDRIYDGIGPEIGIEDWGAFLPVRFPGLAEINYVTPCYWEGAVCHIEAGRK